MADYYLEKLNDNNANIWEEFTNNSEDGSFFHSLKWKQIYENISGSKTNYFLLFKNDNVFGIFPFIEQKIHFFKGYIPMQGFGHHNAIMRNYDDPSTFQYVIDAFQKISDKQKKLSFICFSTLHKETIDNLKKFPNFPYRNDGNVILNFKESSPEKIWDNFSAKKGQRKFIRRFDEKGFSLIELQTHDDLKLFYKYYQENIHFIDGTLLPFSHFTDLWNNLLSNEMRITLLSKDSTVAGGLLMFTFKPQKTVYLHYLSLNRNLSNTYHPTYYLFWEAINWAWNNNYKKISFGAQNLGDTNNRNNIKMEFGGKFEPIYSKMIPLTKIFLLSLKCKQYVNRLNLLNKVEDKYFD